MRILLADLAKARRKLIESKALADAPFFQRLWYHHLFWFCSFVSTEASTTTRGISRRLRRRYCQLADGVFGGNRLARHPERQEQENNQRLERVRELKECLQENANRRFDRHVLYESLTNPKFVATDHIHQDRQ